MKTTEQYLIITNVDDEQIGHVPFVAEHMPQDQLLVIDPVPEILTGQGLTYQWDANGPACLYNDIPLNRVASVWDRRPSALRRDMLHHVDPAYFGYAFNAIRSHAAQFYTLFPEATWVSDHHAILRAENKFLQLREAAGLGFAIPDTVFTCDPGVAQSFIENRDATVIKTPSVEGPTVGDTMFFFFSTKVTPESDVDLTNLHLAPAIFQTAIDGDYELRITVVGEKVFAARVTADAEKNLSIGVRDWRIGNYTGLRIEACGISEDIAAKCVMLVKQLGLRFGAIDMIVDKKGVHWFLEINPNGQWAFIEAATKQPIGQAMARLLLSRRN